MTLKLAKKAVVYELDLAILNDDNGMFQSIEDELVLSLTLKLSMDFL